MEILNDAALAEARDVLLALVVLSLLVEMALAPIFNWRVYLSKFEGGSYIHPLTLIVTIVVLWIYHIDVFGPLFNALGAGVLEGSGAGSLLTSLLVMGGSQAVFRIFNFFSVRDAGQRQQKHADAQSAL